jgi:hypothetical protein
MADRTRPIVRLEVIEGMVTEGYQKGVYERVTMGTREQVIPRTRGAAEKTAGAAWGKI